jgi:hypothetical protein
MVDQGHVRVEVLSRTGRWCGITYPEDREQAITMIASLVEAGEYPQRLWD